jgi:hypothetical protein
MNDADVLGPVDYLVVEFPAREAMATAVPGAGECLERPPAVPRADSCRRCPRITLTRETIIEGRGLRNGATTRRDLQATGEQGGPMRRGLLWALLRGAPQGSVAPLASTQPLSRSRT